jgi:3-isopropylmalate/(R)-2-methylmalate dehydratase small subunit
MGDAQLDIRGRAWTFGDNVPSDHIVASHGILRSMDEIAKDVLRQQHPDFAGSVARGDILVAGRHFGQSSGRQVAAKVLAHVGISCVIAESVARTFWRNAWEIGLPAVECPGVTALVSDGDIVRIRLVAGAVRNETTGAAASFSPPDEFMISMLQAGGIVPLAELKHDEWNL